jgi:hypothetical protein
MLCCASLATASAVSTVSIAFVKDIIDAGMGELALAGERRGAAAPTPTVSLVRALVSQCVSAGMARLVAREAPMFNANASPSKQLQFTKFVEAFTNDLFVQGLKSSIEAMTLAAENESIHEKFFVTAV